MSTWSMSVYVTRFVHKDQLSEIREARETSHEAYLEAIREICGDDRVTKLHVNSSYPNGANVSFGVAD